MNKKVCKFCLLLFLMCSTFIRMELVSEATNIINSKKVSLENMVYLGEDQYYLRNFVQDSRVVSKSEEMLSTILNSRSSKVVLSESDGFSKKQIKTIMAILEHKYFPYFKLEYQEKSLVNYRVEISTSKAKYTYKKNKKLQDCIDNILFNQLKINSNTTEYEALVSINDWFCNNCKYDYSTTTVMSVYDVIINHKGICGSFTDTFKIMCNRIGIECYAVASDKMSHAWNKVIINDKAYYVDVTWNILGWYQEYLLKDEVFMNKTHLKPNWVDTKRVKVPSYYTISYILNDEYETNNSKNPNYFIQGISHKLYSPSKRGYLFKGWYIDSSLTKKISNVNQIGTFSSNITLYPKWEKIQKPKISNVKIKEYSKRIKITWKSTQSSKVKYSIIFRSQDKEFQTISITRNQAVIYKERTTSKNKYTLSIRSYIKDSAGKNIYSKKVIIEDGKIIK